MSDTIIHVEGLEKTFRIGFFRKRVEAVRSATFTVRRGETVGLIGPNGAGKTTTIKMLLGLIRPDAGTASIFGEAVGRPTSRARLGFLPETPHFYDYLRPAELLDYFGDLYGMDKAVKKRRIPELIERVGLAGSTKKQLRKFSKGMLQRIGLAQALLPDPDLVILDEPQSGLDPIGRKDVRDIMLDLKRRGKTVLFSSHILPDVEQVCDRVAIMVEGRVRRVGVLSELVDHSTRYVEAIFHAGAEADPALFQERGFETERLPLGDLRVIVPPGADRHELISAARSAGFELVSMTPHRDDLEAVFVREAQRDVGERPR